MTKEKKTDPIWTRKEGEILESVYGCLCDAVTDIEKGLGVHEYGYLIRYSKKMLGALLRNEPQPQCDDDQPDLPF